MSWPADGAIRWRSWLWVLAHEGVTSVIVGASRVEQLADSLQCLGGAPLRADELERMDDICRAL